MRSSINLFSTKASIPQWVLVIDPYIPLINLILVGISVGITVLYFLFTTFILVRENQIEKVRRQATEKIQAYRPREMKYSIIKNRLPPIEKISKTQKSLAPYLDTAMAIALPPQLVSIYPGEKQLVTLRILLPTIEDGLSIMTKLVELAQAKSLKNPQLNSVSVTTEGVITLIISYTVTL